MTDVTVTLPSGEIRTVPAHTLRARGNEALLAAAQAAHSARKAEADRALAAAIAADRVAWLHPHAWTRILLMAEAKEVLRLARREQLAASIAEAP